MLIFLCSPPCLSLFLFYYVFYSIQEYCLFQGPVQTQFANLKQDSIAGNGAVVEIMKWLENGW